MVMTNFMANNLNKKQNNCSLANFPSLLEGALAAGPPQQTHLLIDAG